VTSFDKAAEATSRLEVIVDEIEQRKKRMFAVGAKM
jgi:hypothetical protein